MINNTLKNVGFGARNKAQASIYVHGVQVTNIKENEFVKSAPIVVEHTVGEPKTEISNNTFNATKTPNVKELIVNGPHTAVLKNNNVLNNKAD